MYDRLRGRCKQRHAASGRVRGSEQHCEPISVPSHVGDSSSRTALCRLCVCIRRRGGGNDVRRGQRLRAEGVAISTFFLEG